MRISLLSFPFSSLSLQLLVALAVFDSTYLAGTILESFRKRFGLATVTHLRLFPQARMYNIAQGGANIYDVGTDGSIDTPTCEQTTHKFLRSEGVENPKMLPTSCMVATYVHNIKGDDGKLNVELK